MSKEINLISSITKKSVVILRLKKKFIQLATLILGLFVLVCAFALATFLFFSIQLSNNEKKMASLKQEINKAQKIESYLVTITSRIDAITTLLKNRQSYLKAISDLKLVLVPGFTPQSLEVSRNGGLKLSGDCADSQLLTKFNDAVEQISQNGKYLKVNYPSVNRSENGRFNITLELKK